MFKFATKKELQVFRKELDSFYIKMLVAMKKDDVAFSSALEVVKKIAITAQSASDKYRVETEKRFSAFEEVGNHNVKAIEEEVARLRKDIKLITDVLDLFIKEAGYKYSAATTVQEPMKITKVKKNK